MLNTLAYLAKTIVPLHIAFEEINSNVDTFSASQGNYVAVCQDNGICQFPFVMGGRLSLLSIVDGRFYTIKDDKSLWGGFVYPALQGDNVYYFESWDGNPQFLYVTNLNNKKKKLVLEQVDMYAILDDKIFYTRGDNDTSLYCKNLKTNREERLIQGNDETELSYLSIKGGSLYCYDRQMGVLYVKPLDTDKINAYYISNISGDWIGAVQPISEDKFLIATGKSGIIEYNSNNGEKIQVVNLGNLSDTEMEYGFYDFYYTNGELYYNDKYYTVYKLNVKTKEKQVIADWSKIKEVQNYIKDIEHVSMHYFYCPDYIAVEIQYYDTNTDFYDHRVIAFDYDGKQVLNTCI